jgi:MFS family permease
MRRRLVLYLGIFAVMALSNAIVPILPIFDSDVAIQGAIYSAYFFGALISVFPAGILSDRTGRFPVVRIGLVLTVLSGIMVTLVTAPYFVFAGRLVEGVGAGFFVAAGMSWVNARPDHEQLSGHFMAALNLGLVTGLLGTGTLVSLLGLPVGGIAAFTLLAVVPFLAGLFVSEESGLAPAGILTFGSMKGLFWLYTSAAILVGATGAVTILYPSFTNMDPPILAVEIALMHVGTIGSVLIAPHFRLAPIPALRFGAVAMALAVIICYFSPLGFPFIGAVAGVVMIAQMSHLAGTGMRQGAIMGLYNTSSYAGMTVLPFVAGVIAEGLGYAGAFIAIAAMAGTMAVSIGWCSCGAE